VIVHHTNMTGLCNRLRGLATWRTVAAMRNEAFRMYWQPSRTCPVEFYELFEGMPLLHLSKITGEEQVVNCEGPWGEGTHACDKPWDIWSRHRPCGNVHYFMKHVQYAMRQLKPTPAVETAFEAARPPYAYHMVGVHVRGTDNVAEAKKQGIYLRAEAYIQRMQQIQRRLPSTEFFVACDNIGDEAAIRDAVPGVHVQPKHYDSQHVRHTTMKAALVDLMILSRCSRIIGTWGSSFSEYAAMLGGIELETPFLTREVVLRQK